MPRTSTTIHCYDTKRARSTSRSLYKERSVDGISKSGGGTSKNIYKERSVDESSKSGGGTLSTIFNYIKEFKLFTNSLESDVHILQNECNLKDHKISQLNLEISNLNSRLKRLEEKQDHDSRRLNDLENDSIRTNNNSKNITNKVNRVVDFIHDGLDEENRRAFKSRVDGYNLSEVENRNIWDDSKSSRLSSNGYASSHHTSSGAHSSTHSTSNISPSNRAYNNSPHFSSNHTSSGARSSTHSLSNGTSNITHYSPYTSLYAKDTKYATDTKFEKTIEVAVISSELSREELEMISDQFDEMIQVSKQPNLFNRKKFKFVAVHAVGDQVDSIKQNHAIFIFVMIGRSILGVDSNEVLKQSLVDGNKYFFIFRRGHQQDFDEQPLEKYHPQHIGVIKYVPDRDTNKKVLAVNDERNQMECRNVAKKILESIGQ